MLNGACARRGFAPFLSALFAIAAPLIAMSPVRARAEVGAEPSFLFSLHAGDVRLVSLDTSVVMSALPDGKVVVTEKAVFENPSSAVVHAEIAEMMNDCEGVTSAEECLDTFDILSMKVRGNETAPRVVTGGFSLAIRAAFGGHDLPRRLPVVDVAFEPNERVTIEHSFEVDKTLIASNHFQRFVMRCPPSVLRADAMHFSIKVENYNGDLAFEPSFTADSEHLTPTRSAHDNAFFTLDLNFAANDWTCPAATGVSLTLVDVLESLMVGSEQPSVQVTQRACPAMNIDDWDYLREFPRDTDARAANTSRWEEAWHALPTELIEICRELPFVAHGGRGRNPAFETTWFNERQFHHGPGADVVYPALFVRKSTFVQSLITPRLHAYLHNADLEVARRRRLSAQHLGGHTWMPEVFLTSYRSPGKSP